MKKKKYLTNTDKLKSNTNIEDKSKMSEFNKKKDGMTLEVFKKWGCKCTG